MEKIDISKILSLKFNPLFVRQIQVAKSLQMIKKKFNID